MTRHRQPRAPEAEEIYKILRNHFSDERVATRANAANIAARFQRLLREYSSKEAFRRASRLDRSLIHLRSVLDNARRAAAGASGEELTEIAREVVPWLERWVALIDGRQQREARSAASAPRPRTLLILALWDLLSGLEQHAGVSPKSRPVLVVTDLLRLALPAAKLTDTAVSRAVERYRASPNRACARFGERPRENVEK